MKKKIFISIFVAVMAVIGISVMSCSGSDPWVISPISAEISLSELKVGGRSVTVKDVDGEPLGSSNPAAAPLIQLTLKSAEVDDSDAPTLSLNVTVSPVIRESAGKKIEYSVSGSESSPGTFTGSNSVKLTNGDVLWIRISASGDEIYYRIKITVEYDANALSAEEFTIIFNPASRAYTPSDSIAPLNVEVSKTGLYKVQWYRNTAMSSNGGTALGTLQISNDSKFTYNPGSLTAENNYFYVEITNEAGKVTSAPALIRITASGELALNTFQISDTRYNYVRGIGGTGAFMFREGGNADASPDADVTYVNKLFQDLGCNNLRIMVQDDYLRYINNEIQSRNSATFFHDARANFFAVIRRVNELGGYVFAQPWTAPASMKTNGSLSGSGGTGSANLRPASYIEYADYLRGFLKWLNANNAPIFLLGILNEPDYGGAANYEGMGMTPLESRDWFKLVGHFTTQEVMNKNAVIANVRYREDIIPGYGGGGPTHHVLVMSGDSAGNVSEYMNPQLADRTEEKNANDRQEVVGRHYYYSNGPRYQEFVGSGVVGNSSASRTHGNPATTWAERGNQSSLTGTSAKGTHNSFNPSYDMAAVLAYSPQMFPPDSTPANVKREIWQTEHDYNHGSSTNPNVTNAYTFWNAAFTAMNWIDYTIRINGESLSNWWFSSSFSGYVTSNHRVGWPEPYTITPRGKAIAHYARYVNETWLLGVERTAGNQVFNNGPNITSSSPDAVPGIDAGSTVPKISAFEDKDGRFISVVMFTPTTSPAGGTIGGGFGSGGSTGNNSTTNGSTNVGRLKLVLPNGYTAGSATAIRSWGKDEGMYWQDEPVFLAADGKSAEVTLPGGNIISIRFMLSQRP